MNIKLLKTAIKQNNIPKLLVFIGDEQAVCKQYIQTMSQTLNKHYKFYDTADEVIIETASNMREDFLYVILNDDKVLKKPDYVKALLQTDRHIILYFTNFDKKCQFYKDNKDYCVSFDKVDKYSLVAYLQTLLQKASIEVSQDRLEKLVDLCDCNVGYCKNELDKIITLGQDKSNTLFDYMLKVGFPDYRQLNVFSFVSRIIDGNKSVLEDQLKFTESIVGTINLIYKNAQNKLGVTNDIRLAKIMQVCSELDCRIKDGTTSDVYALDYLLLKCM